MVHGEIFLQFMQLKNKAVFFNPYLDSIESMLPIINSLWLAQLFQLEILHLEIVNELYGVRNTIERVAEKNGN